MATREVRYVGQLEVCPGQLEKEGAEKGVLQFKASVLDPQNCPSYERFKALIYTAVSRGLCMWEVEDIVRYIVIHYNIYGRSLEDITAMVRPVLCDYNRCDCEDSNNGSNNGQTDDTSTTTSTSITITTTIISRSSKEEANVKSTTNKKKKGPRRNIVQSVEAPQREIVEER